MCAHFTYMHECMCARMYVNVAHQSSPALLKHCSYVLALNRQFLQDPDSCSGGEEQEQEAHPKLTLLRQTAGRDPGSGLQH